jgi:XTP/dITP diphosphohydrolase
MKLLIATNNNGKLIEFQELLTGLPCELVTPAQIGLDLDVVEDGRTYAENAAKKARAFAQASGLIALADDSGLEVDALGGAPGLYSARYGSTDGNKLSDAARRHYLLAQLRTHPQPWTAHFTATIAIAIPNVTLSDSEGSLLQQAQTLPLRENAPIKVTLTEGICPGVIIPAERGTGGFGYDPIFLLPELDQTLAELSMDKKNRLSHRARAVIHARGFLQELFSK